MSFAQAHHFSLFVAFGIVVEVLQFGEFLPTVEQQQLHQSLLHRHRQVEVDHDMREKEFHLLLSCALCVERRSREVYLYEACAFGCTDSVQSSLPFYFFGLSVSLYLVYVMRLVVDNHQVFQSGKVLQFVAAQCSAVEHTEVVASRFAWAHRQQRVHYFCWSNSVRVVIVVFILVCCLVLKEVPVG